MPVSGLLTASSAKYRVFALSSTKFRVLSPEFSKVPGSFGDCCLLRHVCCETHDRAPGSD
eukprot:scaffold6330_cov76-Amphora_coffeaeformis.AAC.1